MELSNFVSLKYFYSKSKLNIINFISAIASFVLVVAALMVRKLLFHGKFYYDLIDHLEKNNILNTAIVRLEQGSCKIKLAFG